jgi:hypothetical protein
MKIDVNASTEPSNNTVHGKHRKQEAPASSKTPPPCPPLASKKLRQKQMPATTKTPPPRPPLAVKKRWKQQMLAATKNAAATSATRSQESPEETNAHRQQNVAAMTAARSQESPEETNARRHQDTTATAAARDQESPEATNDRLRQVATATAAARSQESPEATATRLQATAIARRRAGRSKTITPGSPLRRSSRIDQRTQQQANHFENILNTVRKRSDVRAERAEIAPVEPVAQYPCHNGKVSDFARLIAEDSDKLATDYFDGIESHPMILQALLDFMLTMQEHILSYLRCPCCSELKFGMTLKQENNDPKCAPTCETCCSSKKKNFGVSTFIAKNDADPFPKGYPWHLPHLSMLEEMLIARIHAVMKVYTLTGGALGYKGNVMNMEQNIDGVVAAVTLPWKVEEVPLFIARRHNETTPANLPDFKVSQSKMRKWLEHLKTYHPSYRNIIEKRHDDVPGQLEWFERVPIPKKNRVRDNH